MFENMVICLFFSADFIVQRINKYQVTGLITLIITCGNHSSVISWLKNYSRTYELGVLSVLVQVSLFVRQLGIYPILIYLNWKICHGELSASGHLQKHHQKVDSLAHRSFIESHDVTYRSKYRGCSHRLWPQTACQCAHYSACTAVRRADYAAQHKIGMVSTLARRLVRDSL